MSLKKYGITEKDLLVPISVLIGAVLISAAICFAAGKMPGFGSSISGAQNLNPDSNKKVNLTARQDAPTIGTGKLEIVEFSDFQCPFCQRFFTDAYKQIKEKYIDTGKAKLVYRYMPLSFHPFAQKAAEAAECAYRQGKFELYHDRLFTLGQSDGTGLAVPDLKKYAADLGLNTAQFNQCLDNGEAVEVVKKDVDAANSIGVNGTPSFVIDGNVVVGAQPFSVFEQVIDAALK